MPQIDYDHELAYLVAEEGDLVQGAYPGLWVDLSLPLRPGGPSAYVAAHIDTGAQFSFFDGSLANAIEFDLLAGTAIRLSPTHGPSLEARFHEMRVEHDLLGVFPLQIAFSLGPIRRNLLGQDFLGLVQLGFRHRLSQMFVSLEA